MDWDVIVVGGGLSGCIAAQSLLLRGFKVGIVERCSEARDEFRAEQLVGPQIDHFRRLGLLDAMVEGRASSALTYCGHRGAILDRYTVAQVGMPYVAMVRGARSVLPSNVWIAAKVVAIETSADWQRVSLSDGRSVSARLVVIATGLIPQLIRALGMTSETISKAHSLCLGFDLVLHDWRASLFPLIYYGERLVDHIDYLALFPIRDSIRANLFCYHAQDSAWTAAFARAPENKLRASLPRLELLTGRLSVTSSVQARNNDICVTRNVIKDGVVVIGDAFQSPCPAAGTGIDRIISDVRALERWLPRWFAASCFGAREISLFYNDKEKRAFDAECIRIALYRRAVSTETGVRWRLHRLRVLAQRRLAATVRGYDRVNLIAPTAKIRQRHID